MKEGMVTCGDANPKGNIAFYYKGSCGLQLSIKDAYRCTGCGGWFHRDCIFKHFEEEKDHSIVHNCLKEIEKISNDEGILHLCKKGLERKKSPSPPFAIGRGKFVIFRRVW